jgi:hypothetical protein
MAYQRSAPQSGLHIVTEGIYIFVYSSPLKALFAHKYFFLLVIAVQCLLWFVVKDDPFFGDAIASTSKAANNIYDHNLRTIFYPADADPGHPVFYAYVLAMQWKVLGYNLWVSHLYSCFWAVMLTIAFRKIASLLLPIEQVNIATVFVLLFPTYLSQSAMMLNTMALMCVFLFAVYGVLIQNRWIIVLAGVLMCVTHLQSVFLLLSLACFDLYRHVIFQKTQPFGSWFKSRFRVYTIPVIIFAFWLWAHKQHTGWVLVSPQYADVQELNTLSEYLKAMLLIVWRLVDYGMLPFYLVLLIVYYNQKENRKELMQWFVLLAPCCLAMAVFLSHTIGHRYFMGFGLLVILVAVQALQYLKPMGKILVFLALGFSLIAGNFLYYPGKILGDATLAYRNVFTIEKQLYNEYGDALFYSHAPIANERKHRYLSDKGLTVERINDTDLNHLPAILQSNVNAEFTQAQIDFLAANWYGKSYESGPVYITLFLNPKFYPTATECSFRNPSAFERYLLKLKQNLKN